MKRDLDTGNCEPRPDVDYVVLAAGVSIFLLFVVAVTLAAVLVL